jgi:hypothetical protein
VGDGSTAAQPAGHLARSYRRRGRSCGGRHQAGLLACCIHDGPVVIDIKLASSMQAGLLVCFIQGGAVVDDIRSNS